MELLFKRVSNGLGVLVVRACMRVRACASVQSVQDGSIMLPTLSLDHHRLPSIHWAPSLLTAGPLLTLCSHGWAEACTSVRLLVYARRTAEGRHGSVLLQADSLLCGLAFSLSAQQLDDIAQLVLSPSLFLVGVFSGEFSAFICFNLFPHCSCHPSSVRRHYFSAMET